MAVQDEHDAAKAKYDKSRAALATAFQESDTPGAIELNHQTMEAMGTLVFDSLSQRPLQGLVISSLSGWCPVQAEGTANGTAWYFRARHDHWTFEFGGRLVFEGEYPKASWMPLAIALQYIGRCLEELEKAAKETT